MQNNKGKQKKFKTRIVRTPKMEEILIQCSVDGKIIIAKDKFVKKFKKKVQNGKWMANSVCWMRRRNCWMDQRIADCGDGANGANTWHRCWRVGCVSKWPGPGHWWRIASFRDWPTPDNRPSADDRRGVRPLRGWRMWSPLRWHRTPPFPHWHPEDRRLSWCGSSVPALRVKGAIPAPEPSHRAVAPWLPAPEGHWPLGSRFRNLPLVLAHRPSPAAAAAVPIPEEVVVEEIAGPVLSNPAIQQSSSISRYQVFQQSINPYRATKSTQWEWSEVIATQSSQGKEINGRETW